MANESVEQRLAKLEERVDNIFVVLDSFQKLGRMFMAHRIVYAALLAKQGVEFEGIEDYIEAMYSRTLETHPEIRSDVDSFLEIIRSTHDFLSQND